MNHEELEARIAELEKTYKQTEDKIAQLTGKAQDAAIRYLSSCGSELESLRRQL